MLYSILYLVSTISILYTMYILYICYVLDSKFYILYIIHILNAILLVPSLCTVFNILLLVFYLLWSKSYGFRVDSFLPGLEHLYKNVFTVSFPKRRVRNLRVFLRFWVEVEVNFFRREKICRRDYLDYLKIRAKSGDMENLNSLLKFWTWESGRKIHPTTGVSYAEVTWFTLVNQGLFTPVSLGYPLSVFNKKLYAQTLSIPSALTRIGQLYQSPPSPVPGD